MWLGLDPFRLFTITLNDEYNNELLRELSTHMSLSLRFLGELLNRWWMFPCHVLTQFLAQVQQLEGLLLAQLPGWMLRRGNFKGFSHFFPGRKSATVSSQSSAALLPHSSPSTSSAQPNWCADDDGFVWIRMDTGQWKKLGTDILQDVPGR